MDYAQRCFTCHCTRQGSRAGSSYSARKEEALRHCPCCSGPGETPRPFQKGRGRRKRRRGNTAGEPRLPGSFLPACRTGIDRPCYPCLSTGCEWWRHIPPPDMLHAPIDLPLLTIAGVQRYTLRKGQRCRRPTKLVLTEASPDVDEMKTRPQGTKTRLPSRTMTLPPSLVRDPRLQETHLGRRMTRSL